jgi:hypothetical protein
MSGIVLALSLAFVTAGVATPAWGRAAVLAPSPETTPQEADAEATPTAARERRGRAEIDVSGLGDSGEATHGKIRERVDAVFIRGGVTVTKAPTDPVLEVTVAPLSGDTVGYRISYQVEVEGELRAGSNGFSDCRLCTEDEVVDAAEAAIELAVQYMEVEVEPKPKPKPKVVIDPPPTTPTDQPRVKLGALGKTGIALMSVGVAGLITGVVLAVPAPKNQTTQPTKLYTTRPAGYALLGTGAAVAIAGAVMLVLDRRAAKKAVNAPRTGKQASRRAIVGPTPYLGDGAGVGLVGRF